MTQANRIIAMPSRAANCAIAKLIGDEIADHQMRPPPRISGVI